MSLPRRSSLVISSAVVAALVAPVAVAQDLVRIHAKSTLYQGQRANVRVTTAERGQLLVLRVDTYGRVHVLYPRRPTDDGWVGAGWSVQIRGARGKHAFEVSETGGEGFLLAALAWEPYDFSAYAKDGDWDRVALGRQQIGIGADAEATLLEIVRAVTAGQEFAYDIVSYQVSARRMFAPLWASYYDPWDGCYRPLFGSRWGWGSRWGFEYRWSYPFAPIGFDPFYWYSDYYAYRAWCGYGLYRYAFWRLPVVVVAGPGQQRGRYWFKDAPTVPRIKGIEPRRRDTVAVRPRLVDLSYRETPPLARDVKQRHVAFERVRRQNLWSGFRPGDFAATRPGSGSAWPGSSLGAATTRAGSTGTARSDRDKSTPATGWTREINKGRPN